MYLREKNVVIFHFTMSKKNQRLSIKYPLDLCATIHRRMTEKMPPDLAWKRCFFLIWKSLDFNHLKQGGRWKIIETILTGDAHKSSWLLLVARPLVSRHQFPWMHPGKSHSLLMKFPAMRCSMNGSNRQWTKPSISRVSTDITTAITMAMTIWLTSYIYIYISHIYSHL